MTPTSRFSPSRATYPANDAATPGGNCPFPPVYHTASTAIASVLAGATTSLLAYASGMDASAAVLTGIAVFSGGMLIWLAETFSMMRQQHFLHATMQHVVFNGMHVAVSGLLGAVPASLGAQQLAAQFVVHPNASLAAEPAPSNAGSTAPPEISAAGFGLLVGAIALPTFAVCYGFGRTLGSMREQGSDKDDAVTETTAPRRACLDSSAFWRTVELAGPLLLTGALLVAPAYTAHHFGGSESGVRFLVLCIGNVAGSTLREILNQTTARAWTSIRRTGAGLRYGLSTESELDRPWSTIVPTCTSIALFAASSAMFQVLSDSYPELQLVPPGVSILNLTAAEFARRACMRQLMVNVPGEMLEALWRYLPIGAYAAIRKLPLEYRRKRGCGLVHSPRQFARHVTDTASYQKAIAFAGVRVVDGSLVGALSMLPDCRWGAPILQGVTMLRTPMLAALVLPKVGLPAESTIDLVAAGQEDEDSTAVTNGSSADAGDSSVPEVQAHALERLRDTNASSYLHTYF